MLSRVLSVTALAAVTTVPAVASAAPAARCVSPARIVSLSPTGTEMLFAVGAGPRVVAVDDQSTYPARAPRTKLSGYTPNVEAVLAYRPSLVLMSGDANHAVAGLRAAGVRVVVQPAAVRLSDSYREIRQLGGITCRARAAAAVVARMNRGIGAAVASVPASRRGGTYYHELDNTLYSVTSDTFIGRVYGLFGMRSVADAADAQGTGYPQLSNEGIIAADPGRIFLADTRCCHQSAATVATRPGWSTMQHRSAPCWTGYRAPIPPCIGRCSTRTGICIAL